MTRWLVACGVLLLFSGAARATNQFPDRIVYRDTDCAVSTSWQWPSILQVYYLVNQNHEYPYTATSTACYRGHIATWAISEGKLFLLKLEARESVPYGNSYRMATRTLAIPGVFRRKMVGDRVFADWFTGFIVVYESAERLFLVELERGRVQAEKPYSAAAWDALAAAANSGGATGDALFDSNLAYMKKLVAFQAGTVSAADMNMAPDPVDWPAAAIIILPGAVLALLVIVGWCFYAARKARRRNDPPAG